MVQKVEKVRFTTFRPFVYARIRFSYTKLTVSCTWIALVQRQKWAFTTDTSHNTLSKTLSTLLHSHPPDHYIQSITHIKWPNITLDMCWTVFCSHERSILSNMQCVQEGHTALLDKNNREINSSSWGLLTLYKSILLINVHVFRDIHTYTTLKPHAQSA